MYPCCVFGVFLNFVPLAHTHTHTTVYGLLDFVPDYPGEPTPERQNQSGFTGERDSEWQWHQLGCMKICTLTQTHYHTSIPPRSFLQAGCPSCCPNNSVKALKAMASWWNLPIQYVWHCHCCSYWRWHRQRSSVSDADCNDPTCCCRLASFRRTQTPRQTFRLHALVHLNCLNNTFYFQHC